MRKRMFRALKTLPIALLCAMATTAFAETVKVKATPVPLVASHPEVVKIDALTYHGGLLLQSDHADFGGLSGLAISTDGSRLYAVSDRGYLFTMTPSFDQSGDLVDIAQVTIERLSGEDGRDLPETKWGADSEALAIDEANALVVAFEHDHKLIVYDGEAAPRRVALPKAMAAAPRNGGIEGLTVLADGRYFIVTESLSTGPNTVAGWIGGPDTWVPFHYTNRKGFLPTGATALSNGDVLVVERRYSVFDGQDTRIRRVDAKSLTPGSTADPPVVAELHEPIVVDNFEGITSGALPSGAHRLFLISDDNFNTGQQTLLLSFSIDED